MSEPLIVREHHTPIPTSVLERSGFQVGDEAVAEIVPGGVLIRPLTAAEAVGRPATTTRWLPPVARRMSGPA